MVGVAHERCPGWDGGFPFGALNPANISWGEGSRGGRPEVVICFSSSFSSECSGSFPLGHLSGTSATETQGCILCTGVFGVTVKEHARPSPSFCGTAELRRNAEGGRGFG